MNFEENEIPHAVLDKYTKVCTCRGINRLTIKKAIQDGAHTLQAVQKQTGAGSGSCKGRNCSPKILDLLEKHSNSR